jgi:hypothetical protein
MPPFGADETHDQGGGQMAQVYRDIGVNLLHISIARAFGIFDEIMAQQPFLSISGFGIQLEHIVQVFYARCDFIH